MEVTIQWGVEDGYVGKDRPQRTKVDIEREIMPLDEWNDLSDEEKKHELSEVVQADFEQKVSFFIFRS